MKHVLAVLAAGALAIGAVPMTAAQMQHGDMKGMNHAQPAKSQVHKGIGVVTNFERNSGKVTLKHEPIASLNWPGMTMAFTVKDKALLDNLAKDKKVQFEFIQEGKQYVITSIK
ncbi:MAG TPA: copper-binding protein [Burkholderiales bacterium]